MVELYRNHESEDYEAVSSSGWFATALFLIVGAAQAGVLGGFFMLTWLDSSLLDEMLSSGEHTIAEVLVWNHARFSHHRGLHSVGFSFPFVGT